MRTWMLGVVVGLAACAEDLRAVDASLGHGAAVQAWENAAQRVRVERFEWGEDVRTPVADFLFVIDPSVSMYAVIDRVQQGFQGLVEDEVFPSKSRIAITTMVPGDGLAHAPHPAVRPFKGLSKLPGFLGLVNRDAIEAFRAATTEEIAAAYPHDGCAPWFAPGELDPAGVPCLVAHTQVPLRSMKAEAGMVSLMQLFARRADKPVFRPGAAVNVVFVSDTHDPGVPNPDRDPRAEELAAMTPRPEQLVQVILASQPVTAVRFHAIAPVTECVERWSPAGPTYLEAARATGGEILDLCEADDYGPFIRAIADKGARVEQAVFPLGREVDEVEQVLVAGAPRAWTVVGGSVVRVPDLEAAERADVEVRYRWADEVPREAPSRPSVERPGPQPVGVDGAPEAPAAQPEGRRPRRDPPQAAAGRAVRRAPLNDGPRAAPTPAE